MRVWTGQPYPLGATWDGVGVNFALFAEHATAVELCLFDSPYAGRESMRIPLPVRDDFIWHAYLPDVKPGQLYGYRVDGLYDPAAGYRFNPAKLLVDPYAKCIGRQIRWHDSLFGFTIDHADSDLSKDDRDTAAYAPLGAVIDPSFTSGDDRPPRTPWHDTVIYEAHVRGFSKRHPDIPEDLRGTYLGLVSEPALNHFRRLGVTAIELMPIHHHADEWHLVKRKQTNGAGAVFSTMTVTDKNFHHVPVTKTGGTVVFFLDGIAETVAPYDPSFVFQGPVAIGARGGDYAASFLGTIDEISVYNRALATGEIQAIYNAGTLGKCSTATAPSITGQPSDQTEPVGGTATFSVTASGTAPLSYQWQWNGANLNGATASTLVLTDVQLTNAGSYSVTVSNLAGVVISSNATLTVNAATSCVTLPSGLVSWWRGEANALDFTTTNNGA